MRMRVLTGPEVSVSDFSPVVLVSSCQHPANPATYSSAMRKGHGSTKVRSCILKENSKD